MKPRGLLDDPFAHLHPSVRHLATADDEIRMRAIISDTWLTYPAGDMVVSQLFELVRMPRRLRMPSLLVYAPPNSGKSRIIRRFLELYLAQVASEICDPGAVISIQAPPTVDEKRLYLEILRALQAATPDATVGRLRNMVVRQLETRKVQLLIIDEMQHIFDQSPLRYASADPLIIIALALPFRSFHRLGARAEAWSPAVRARWEAASTVAVFSGFT